MSVFSLYEIILFEGDLLLESSFTILPYLFLQSDYILVPG